MFFLRQVPVWGVLGCYLKNMRNWSSVNFKKKMQDNIFIVAPPHKSQVVASLPTRPALKKIALLYNI